MGDEVWKGRLLRYFYQELSEEERAEMERHLLECPSCQKELEELRALSEKLSKVIKGEPGPEVMEQIISKARLKVRGEGSALRARGIRLRWALSLGSAWALALLLVFVLWFSRDQVRTEDYDLNQMFAGLELMEEEMPEGTLVSFYFSDSDFSGSESSQSEFEIIEQGLEEIEELGKGIFEL